MPDALVRSTTYRELFVATAAGVPDTGATLTYTLTSPAGTVLLSAVATTHVGEGWYQVAVDGSQYLTLAGWYQELWQGSTGSVDHYYPGGFLVGVPHGLETTRRELRHRIARGLGDLWVGVATGGSSTTLADTDRVEPNNHWRGARLYVYAGTGAGQERLVSSSAQSGGVLTVSKAWGTTPDTTSRYELHAPQGSPHGALSVEDYHDAINAAISELAEYGAMVLTDESVAITSDTTYEYEIPACFWRVRRVSWRDTTDAAADWEELVRQPPGRLGAPAEWDVLTGRQRLRLRAPRANYRVRLEGLMLPQPLWRDSSYADLPTAWIEWLAMAKLLMGGVRGPQYDAEGRGQRVAVALQRVRDIVPKRKPLHLGVLV